MAPRIAIPLPLSNNPEYVERSMPQYEHAVELAGGEPVRIPLNSSREEIVKILEGCDGVLLPGSSADVDPLEYGAARHSKTAPADAPRHQLDFLLLQNAYEHRKPVLGICYGMQSLNVFRAGTLVQHIESAINHEAGRKVPIAHKVDIEAGTRLARIVGGDPAFTRPINETRDVSVSTAVTIAVNSSHHQSVDLAGKGLRIVAQSPEDGIVEAVEGTSPDHLVLAVQWHPERSVDEDEPSRAIFRALVEAAKAQPAVRKG